MAYASARVQAVGTGTSTRLASLLHGHRFVKSNAVRARLPCGCVSHKHSCQKHAVTTAHPRCQGSATVGAMSAASPSIPAIARGVNGRAFASAARSSRRAASVSSAPAFAIVCQMSAHTALCVLSTKLYNQRVGPSRLTMTAIKQHIALDACSVNELTREQPCLQRSLRALRRTSPKCFVQVQVVHASTAQGEVEESAQGELLIHCQLHA